MTYLHFHQNIRFIFKILQVGMILSLALSPSSEAARVPSITEVAVSFSSSDAESVREELRRRTKVKAKHGQVVLIDDAGLSLLKQGVVLRLRAFEKKEEITLKVRSPLRFPNPRHYRNAKSKCERDLSPDSQRVSCSITIPLRKGSLKNILKNRDRILDFVPRNLWAFGREARGQALRISRLKVTEPAKIEVWKFEATNLAPNFKPELSLEVWTLPNKVQLVELSMKDRSSLAASHLRDLRNWLEQRKIVLTTIVPSKSEQFLKFLQ